MQADAQKVKFFMQMQEYKKSVFLLVMQLFRITASKKLRSAVFD